MIIGTIIGVEIGAQVVEAIKEIGKADQIIGWAYVAILVAIGSFTAIESIRAIRMIHTDKIKAKEAVGFTGLTKRIQLIRLEPMISLPASGIASISLWVIIISGLISGTLAGFLGVGGGFIRMPLMVYVLGIPTHVAIGTDLFEIIFSLFSLETIVLSTIMVLVMSPTSAVSPPVEVMLILFFFNKLITSFVPSIISEITLPGIKCLFLPIVEDMSILSIAPTQIKSSTFIINAS